MTQHTFDEYSSAPVRPGADQFGDWLTVADAVLYAEFRGLTRTPKTIRKWAARSQQRPEQADISARQEDTGNGFRWVIERVSLDRKINEELEFEARQNPEQVETNPNLSEQTPEQANPENSDEPAAHQTEPVRTSSEGDTPRNNEVVDLLKEQLEKSYTEIEFLRGELTHRRRTDDALSGVIEAFRLNAETQNSNALAPAPERRPEQTNRSFHPRGVRDDESVDSDKREMFGEGV